MVNHDMALRADVLIDGQTIKAVAPDLEVMTKYCRPAPAQPPPPSRSAPLATAARAVQGRGRERKREGKGDRRAKENKARRAKNKRGEANALLSFRVLSFSASTPPRWCRGHVFSPPATADG